MKLAIMQPYFLPYLGYFQLVHAVDTFVVYDNIQFTKKGWTHRNRILTNDTAAMFTIPLKRASDYLEIGQRELASTFSVERDKILRRIEGAYRKAPYFRDAMPVTEKCFSCNETNLFLFVYDAIRTILDYLRISTPVSVSSRLNVDHSLKSQDRVIAMCKSLGAKYYINPPGGKDLYNSDDFSRADLNLAFLEPNIQPYRQFDGPFVPNLSIIDVIMFNPKDEINRLLSSYSVQPAKPSTSLI